MSAKIGVVIPAYNEASVIQETLNSLPSKISKNDLTLIVVNDGSTDQTEAVVSQFRQVHLINHILNSGAGAATRTGIHYAQRLGCNYVVTMDGDGQHQAVDVEKIAREIMKNDADFIIGSRLLQSKGMPWYRRLGNKFLSFMTFLFFGVMVTDSQSGLKALNQKAISSINFHSNHYAFCSEMIWRAKQKKLKVKEVPITAIYTEYSLAKGQSNWGALAIIKQLFKRRLLGMLDE